LSEFIKYYFIVAKEKPPRLRVASKGTKRDGYVVLSISDWSVDKTDHLKSLSSQMIGNGIIADFIYLV